MSFEWGNESTIGQLIADFGGSIKTGPFGTSLKASEYVSEGVPLISVREIGHGSFNIDSKTPRVSPETTTRLSEYLLEAGDIVFARKGGIERCSLVRKAQAGWFLGSDGIRLRPPKNCDARFLAYSLQTQTVKDWLIQHSTGSTMASLNQATIARLPICIPAIDEQRKIAGCLEAIDDRIGLLRETNATLEAIAQALFKSWFVDFDPVHAKQQGRMPEGMDEGTAALFPGSFEESELGLVPRGWRLMPFGQLLSHTVGGDWGDEEPNEKNDIKVAIIRGTDIPDLHSGANHRVPIRYTSAKKLLNRKLQHGDIVIEVSGGSKGQPTGRSLYLTEQMLKQFDCSVEPASFCRLLRPISDDLGILLGQHLTYIYDQGKTWEYQNQSTGIANFQTTHFLETELVAVPSDEVLNEFANVIRPLIDRTHLSQMRQLAGLRDTLLPRLISGQIRLPEAEALLELV